jgi:transcriptional regulator with XRE-family HTH domain
MRTARDLTSPTERIAWAIEQMKAAGISLEELARLIGCSHAALSQWQMGRTNIENVKAGLLDKFCEVTGTSLQWILHGGDVRVLAYPSSELIAGLVGKLQALHERDPIALMLVGRMIDAAAEPGDPPAAPPSPPHN